VLQYRVQYTKESVRQITVVGADSTAEAVGWSGDVRCGTNSDQRFRRREMSLWADYVEKVGRFSSRKICQIVHDTFD
jgi:hypothetical protein